MLKVLELGRADKSVSLSIKNCNLSYIFLALNELYNPFIRSFRKRGGKDLMF